MVCRLIKKKIKNQQHFFIPKAILLGAIVWSVSFHSHVVLADKPRPDLPKHRVGTLPQQLIRANWIGLQRSVTHFSIPQTQKNIQNFTVQARNIGVGAQKVSKDIEKGVRHAGEQLEKMFPF